MQKVYNHLKRIICFALTISTVVCSTYFRPVKVYAIDPMTNIQIYRYLIETVLSSVGLSGYAGSIDDPMFQPSFSLFETLDNNLQSGAISEREFLTSLSSKAYSVDFATSNLGKALNAISYSRSGIASSHGIQNILQNISTYYEQHPNVSFKDDLHNLYLIVTDPANNAGNPVGSMISLTPAYAVLLADLLEPAGEIRKLLVDDDDKPLAGAVLENTEFDAYNFDATGEEIVIDYLLSPISYQYKLLNEPYTGKNGWIINSSNNYGIYIGQDYNIGAVMRNDSGHYYIQRTAYSLRGYGSDQWQFTVLTGGVPIFQYPTDIDEAYTSKDPRYIVNASKPGYQAFLDDILPRSLELDSAVNDLLFNRLPWNQVLPQVQSLTDTIPGYLGSSLTIPKLKELLQPVLAGETGNILEQILTATKSLLLPMTSSQTAIRVLADGFPAITQDLDDIVDIFPAITASLEDIIEVIPASTDIIATIINPIPGQLEDLGSAIIDLPGQIALPIVGVLEGIAADLSDVKAKVLEGDLPSPPGGEDEDPERDGNGINPTGGLNAPFLALIATLIFLLMLLLKLLILFFNLFMYIVMIFNIPPSPAFLNDDMVSAIEYLKTLQIGNMGISVWHFLFGLIYIIMFFALIKLLRKFVERIELPS